MNKRKKSRVWSTCLQDRDILDLIHRLDPRNSRKDWTRKVLSALRALGKQKGYCVSPDERADQGEYLLDMMWQAEPGCADCMLAVESDQGSLNADNFEKLMHVKSSQKLYILRTANFKSVEQNIREKLELQLMATFGQHATGEQYFLLAFSKRDLTAWFYKWGVPRNGRTGKMAFRKMEPIPLRKRMLRA
jgi:hypothetical protein